MAKLDAAERKKIPTKDYADPEDRKYPDENRTHAIDAKGRAKQMLDKGRITQAKYDEICRRADAKLGKSM